MLPVSVHFWLLNEGVKDWTGLDKARCYRRALLSPVKARYIAPEQAARGEPDPNRQGKLAVYPARLVVVVSLKPSSRSTQRALSLASV